MADPIEVAASELPTAVVEFLFRHPPADVARKTVAVDVVDVLVELETHSSDRAMQRRWLAMLQVLALPAAVVAAAKAVSSPGALPVVQQAGAVTPPAAGSFTLTFRRSDLQRILQAQVPELALEFSCSRLVVTGSFANLLQATPLKATPLHATPPDAALTSDAVTRKLPLAATPTPGAAAGKPPASPPPSAQRQDDDDIPNDLSSPARDVAREGAEGAAARQAAAAASGGMLQFVPLGSSATAGAVDVPSVPVVGDSSQLLAQPAERIYVLNPRRCHQKLTPLVAERFVPAEALQQQVPAWALYQRAEHQLENWTQLGISFDDASVNFARAGREFATLPDDAVMAGNCFIRAADCRRCVEDLDGQAELLLEAAEAYAKGENRLAQGASVVAYREAIRLYEQEQRPAKAAKHARQAAEVAVYAGNPMDAVTLLHYAANVYQALGNLADVRSCLARATGITIMECGNYVEAIACLEKLADVCPCGKEQSYALFRALVARMVCIPSAWGAEAVDAIHDCREVFSAYVDACPALLNGAESECIERAISGLLREDPDIVDAAFGKYGRSHTLEEWLSPLFWAIHQSSLQRRDQHLKLYTL